MGYSVDKFGVPVRKNGHSWRCLEMQGRFSASMHNKHLSSAGATPCATLVVLPVLPWRDCGNIRTHGQVV